MPAVLQLCCTLAVPGALLKFPRHKSQPRQITLESLGWVSDSQWFQWTAWASNSTWWDPNPQQYPALSLGPLACFSLHLEGVSTCRSHGNNLARTLSPVSPTTHYSSSPAVHSSAGDTPAPPSSALLFSHTSRSSVKSAMVSWFLFHNLWVFVWIFK